MSKVRLEREGDLAVVTFDSPPLNLFDAELERELGEAVSELEREPARAVLFRAEGRVVSGGVDVSLFAALGTSDASATQFDRGIELTGRVERLDCPTVFAAHALCLTWAFELALACDLILAASSATLSSALRTLSGPSRRPCSMNSHGSRRFAGRRATHSSSSSFSCGCSGM